MTRWCLPVVTPASVELVSFPLKQTLFPTAPPESQQETLPLPGSAEPKWPHVSLGNKTRLF